MKRKRQVKKPWLAGLLNIIYGAGYIYNGKRKVFGWILFIGALITFVEGIYLGYTTGVESETTPGMWIAGILITLAFVYDAYTEAQSINVEKRGRK